MDRQSLNYVQINDVLEVSRHYTPALKFEREHGMTPQKAYPGNDYPKEWLYKDYTWSETSRVTKIVKDSNGNVATIRFVNAEPIVWDHKHQDWGFVTDVEKV